MPDTGHGSNSGAQRYLVGNRFGLGLPDLVGTRPPAPLAKDPGPASRGLLHLPPAPSGNGGYRTMWSESDLVIPYPVPAAEVARKAEALREALGRLCAARGADEPPPAP